MALWEIWASVSKRQFGLKCGTQLARSGSWWMTLLRSETSRWRPHYFGDLSYFPRAIVLQNLVFTCSHFSFFLGLILWHYFGLPANLIASLHCPWLRSAHEASPAGSEAGLPGVIKKQVGGLHVLNSCFQRDYRPVLSIKENHRFQRSNRPHHQIKKAEKIDANSWSWF